MRRIFLALVTIGFVLPVIWTALTSVGIQHTNTESPPAWRLDLSLENYAQIKSEQTFFWRELFTSVWLSLAVTGTTVATAFMAAYSFARSAFRRKQLVVNSFLILSSIPVISYAIPLDITLLHLHLHDTLRGVLLAESALFAPLAAFILYGYLAHLPVDYEEAALLDGANFIGLLLRVVLPLVAPGLIATGVIVFVLSWNQFFLPLMLTSTEIKTIPVMMRDFFTLDREFDWPKVAAVLVISLIPVGLFVTAAHRSLEWFSLNIDDPQD
jgi:ABC-type glycerol-3-phosphate transport system permease component